MASTDLSSVDHQIDGATSDAPAKPSFRDRQFRAREEAILDAANALMAEKGFELMSMDDVAAAVGIAKGSVYRHFVSKEMLAAAAMTRLLVRISAHLVTQDEHAPPLQRLRALLTWALAERAAGRLPLLPSTNPTLQDSLLSNAGYTAALTEVGERLAELVERAQEAGQIRQDLPVPLILYSIYARSCDPTFDFLRRTGQWSDEELGNLMVSACFEGLAEA